MSHEISHKLSAHNINTTLHQALAHHQCGNVQEAQDLYQIILNSNPDHPDALHLMGLLKYQSGDFSSAAALIKKAISLTPTASMYSNLGAVFQAMNQLDEAESSLLKALDLQPGYADALNNIGNLLLSKGDSQRSIEYFAQAIASNPNQLDAINNLGNAYKNIGNLDQAVLCYQQAIQINPDYANALNNLGVTLHAMGKLDEAIIYYQRTLELRKNDPGAWINMGNAYLASSQFEKAEECYRQAIAANPDRIESYSNLALVLQAEGKVSEALQSLHDALKIKPDFVNAHSNLIFLMDLHPGISVSELQQERKRWAQTHADSLAPGAPAETLPHPDKKLRIGYVSADFRKHSAFHVFRHMLTEFDSDKFEVVAYSNATAEDDCTALIKQRCSAWRVITGLSDQSASELIMSDKIDILVDLSGFTEGNRLLVFARKPAPIQITAWGYIGGTGMKAMDYFFADNIVIPAGEKSLYAEEIVFLPNIVCYSPFEPFPAVNPLPALSGRGVTFGSFNRLAKITPETFTTWAQVLMAVPNSRLILKTPELDDETCHSRVLQTLQNLGISVERIILQGKTSWHEHMVTFNQVDIALDPFPHGGGVTTVEGIMMGVPVVTLRWPTLVGRLSASILSPMGLNDWVAESADEYVNIAVEKANDLMNLAILRKKLRDTATSSLVANPVAYTREVEKIYISLWQHWCLS